MLLIGFAYDNSTDLPASSVCYRKIGDSRFDAAARLCSSPCKSVTSMMMMRMGSTRDRVLRDRGDLVAAPDATARGGTQSQLFVPKAGL